MPEEKAKPQSDYRTAVANVRETAKWTLRSLAAVGAVAAAGFSISALTSLETPWTLVLGVGGVAMAMVGVGVSIVRVAKVLLPSTATFDQLIEGERTGKSPYRHVRETLLNKARLLAGCDVDSFEALRAAENASYTDARVAAERYNQSLRWSARANQADHDAYRESQEKELRSQELSSLRVRIVEFAALIEIRRRFNLAWQMLGAFLVLAGLVMVGVASALPNTPDPDLHGAELVDADLSGVSLTDANLSDLTLERVDLSGADLREANFSGAILKRVNLRHARTEGVDFTDTEFLLTLCPDGIWSRNAGGTCLHHLDW